MGQLSAKLRNVQGGFSYWCQGCEEMHAVNAGWQFDGNLEAPTFSPSVLVTSGHYAPGWTGPSCWCTYNAEHPDKAAPFKCSRCHTFIKGGMVQFLGDCTHALAGQTLPLPDLPHEHRDGSHDAVGGSPK
jgi:hypothetical protein